GSSRAAENAISAEKSEPWKSMTTGHPAGGGVPTGSSKWTLRLARPVSTETVCLVHVKLAPTRAQREGAASSERPAAAPSRSPGAPPSPLGGATVASRPAPASSPCPEQ